MFPYVVSGLVCFFASFLGGVPVAAARAMGGILSLAWLGILVWIVVEYTFGTAALAALVGIGAATAAVGVGKVFGMPVRGSY
jgi:hypothetical protein